MVSLLSCCLLPISTLFTSWSLPVYSSLIPQRKRTSGPLTNVRLIIDPAPTLSLRRAMSCQAIFLGRANSCIYRACPPFPLLVTMRNSCLSRAWRGLELIGSVLLLALWCPLWRLFRGRMVPKWTYTFLAAYSRRNLGMAVDQLLDFRNHFPSCKPLVCDLPRFHHLLQMIRGRSPEIYI